MRSGDLRWGDVRKLCMMGGIVRKLCIRKGDMMKHGLRS